MTIVDFPEGNAVFARNQHEYKPLPAWTDGNLVITCYRLSWWERVKMFLTGRVWFQQLTGGLPLQPQRPTVDYPFRPLTRAEVLAREKAAADAEPDPDRGPDVPETPDPTIDGPYTETDAPEPVEGVRRPLRLRAADVESDPTTEPGASTN